MTEPGESVNGIGRTWDHEDCPRDDCDGELQQQDQFNVMCLSCESVWSHIKSETKHYLQTQDFETVAEKPVVMADGGQVEGDNERFVIVGCGAAKRDGSYGQTYPAKDLYTSTYFKKKREYAEVRGDHWMILSAEHGLVPPNAELRPYETSIDDLGEDDLDQLAHEVGMDLIDWVAWEQGNGVEVDEIVVLAGKKYIEPLRERETFHAGIEPTVVFPLQQNDLGGIGEQMSWLKSRVEAQESEQTKLVTDGGRAEDEADRRPMSGREVTGDCPSCGKTVRYYGYHPGVFLCGDCGGERPHAEGVVERDGRLYYEPDNRSLSPGTKRNGGDDE